MDKTTRQHKKLIKRRKPNRSVGRYPFIFLSAARGNGYGISYCICSQQCLKTFG